MITFPRKHNLSNLDLERRTATCSVCGPAQIYLDYQKKPRCLKGKRERKEATQHLHEERKRLRNPNWQPKLVHRVSQVDPETMKGSCSVCGPTQVYKMNVKNRESYRCVTTKKAIIESLHPIARGSEPPHRLTGVDLEQRTAICSVCGPTKIYVWPPNGYGIVNRVCASKKRNQRKKDRVEAVRPSKGKPQFVPNPDC